MLRTGDCRFILSFHRLPGHFLIPSDHPKLSCPAALTPGEADTSSGFSLPTSPDGQYPVA
ncbi:hypothetical protein ASZ90_016976 [hydrocarbon metagenome]|uniref:Uncharacterized protein n=1 Tax=hydrocarbon metagenome TaxID=938273 RepID=A0A0W8EAL0_9ZZZZ